MKFSLPRDTFAQTVTWVARTLPSRPANPVLAGIKIEAMDGLLRLSAFDYQTSAQAEIEADVEEQGAILVSGKMLADIVNALPAGLVSVFLDGTKIVIKSGPSKFQLLSMPLAEYPALPEFPTQGGQIDAAVFAAAIGQVAVAASRDETLPLLAAVHIVIEGESVKVLSTDRYRLAKGQTSWAPDTHDASFDLLVKSKVLHDTAKSVQGGGTVTLTVDSQGRTVGFSADGRQVTTLVVDGDYPPVDRLFPTESPTTVLVNTADLRDAVKRVALVAEKNAPIRLSFTEGIVTLDAGSGDDASASEPLAATVNGEDISVAFNPQFLLDGINAIPSPYLRLSLTNSAKPVLFNGVSEEGEDVNSYQYLLVPIRAAR